jgi:hypothetical protein
MHIKECSHSVCSTFSLVLFVLRMYAHHVFSARHAPVRMRLANMYDNGAHVPCCHLVKGFLPARPLAYIVGLFNMGRQRSTQTLTCKNKIQTEWVTNISDSQPSVVCPRQGLSLAASRPAHNISPLLPSLPFHTLISQRPPSSICRPCSWPWSLVRSHLFPRL